MASTSGSPQIDDIPPEFEDSRVDSQLNSKHTIFLSHSGTQKAFVEQLYEDLGRRGHSPFFDQSPGSLKKGERFAERIFKAARECTVAVVVLSNEFLESKWPMLELATFVEAREASNKKLCLFPLFYRLEASELKEAATTKKALWQKMAAEDAGKRIHVDEWINAIRVLGGVNGEVFSRYGGSEVRYRKAIVDAVCQLCRRYGQGDRVPSMVGKDRLCKIMEEEFEKLRTKSGGPEARMLGLYGTRGMGKTFICKALCDHFSEKYSGRVCYVECSDGTYLEVLKLILEELTDIDEKMLKKLKNGKQAYDALKRYLPQQDVFLALDDVQDHQDWPRLTWLSAKSKVIVTSRSKVNVQSAVGSHGSCLPCATLTESDAVKLFVQSAGCAELDDNVLWKDHEVETLKKCVKLSFFQNDDSDPVLDPYEELKLVAMETDEEMEVLKKCIKLSLSENDSGSSLIPDSSEKRGYHNPLVLVAMGTTIKEDNALEAKNLMDKCKRWESLHQQEGRMLIDILKEKFYLLTPDEKSLFLDVALFYPIKSLGDVEIVGILDRLLKWLETVDGRSRREILHKLEKVKDLNTAACKDYRNVDVFVNIYGVMSGKGGKGSFKRGVDYGDEDIGHSMRCYDKAIEILTLLEISPESTHDVFASDYQNPLKAHGKNYLNRAVLRIKLNNFEGALEDLQKANIFYPQHPYIYMLLGEVKFKAMQLEDSLKYLDCAIALYPTTREGTAFAADYTRAFASRAAVKTHLHDLVGAVQDINFAKALAPSSDYVEYWRDAIYRIGGPLLDQCDEYGTIFTKIEP